MSLCLSVSLSLVIFVSLSMSLYICLCLSVCPCLCLSLSLSHALFLSLSLFLSAWLNHVPALDMTEPIVDNEERAMIERRRWYNDDDGVASVFQRMARYVSNMFSCCVSPLRRSSRLVRPIPGYPRPRRDCVLVFRTSGISQGEPRHRG